jgi:hypothetical protein
MLDSIPTRFGPVDGVLALAARHAISVVATPALLVLDDLHLRLGIAEISTGVVPPCERPTDRWFRHMRDLFRRDPHGSSRDFGSAHTPPAWTAAPRGVTGRLRKASTEERKTVGRLFWAAAAWLLAEVNVMEEKVTLAGRVYHRKPRPFALVPTPAVERLWGVSRAHTILLNHVGPEDIDCLLRARYDTVLDWCHPGEKGKHGSSR